MNTFTLAFALVAALNVAFAVPMNKPLPPTPPKSSKLQILKFNLNL